MEEDLKKVLGLTPKELKAIELRFYENMTQAQAGKEMGITSSRMRQLETKAIRKMRRALTVLNVLEDRI